MSQYSLQMAAVFPSSEAANTFADEVEKLISICPKPDGRSLIVVLNSRREGVALIAIARELGGKAEVKVVAEDD